MAAAVTNPYKFTWGTFVVGDTQERLVTGVHRVHKDFNGFEITLDVLIRGTSDSTFAANCAEMESEFSKRRLLLLVQVGSSTVQTFNPAAGTNTGLNSYARIDKVGTPGADTDRSRLYTVTLGCELPATDTSGRRDSSLTVKYDPARGRTVTISGVWTALTTLEATAQYAAQISAFCTSALSGLLPAGTFELFDEETKRDDQDKTLTFSRVFREIYIAQPGGSLDNASIVEAKLMWARSIDAPGDSGGGNVKRLEGVHARFECWLDKTVSTDLATLYTGTILPYIKAQLAERFRPTQFAILSERPSYIPYTNQFTVEIEFTCAIGATDVIESVITQKFSSENGHVFTGAWTGDPDAHWVNKGHRVRLRTSMRAVRVLGTIGPQERLGESGGSLWGVAFSGGGEIAREGPWGGGGNGTLQPDGFFDSLTQAGRDRAAGGSESGWILISNESSAIPKWIGQPNGDQIAVTDIMETTVERYVSKPKASGGGGAGGGGGTIPVGRIS